MTSNLSEHLSQFKSSFRQKLELYLTAQDQSLDLVFQEELAARSSKIPVNSDQRIYAPFVNGYAGISLAIDTVGILAEHFIALHRTPTGELGRRTHFWVDLWGRAEASRAFQLELLSLWQNKPPEQRITVFQEGVKLLILECLSGISSEQGQSMIMLDLSKISAQLSKLTSGLTTEALLSIS